MTEMNVLKKTIILFVLMLSLMSVAYALPSDVISSYDVVAQQNDFLVTATINDDLIYHEIEFFVDGASVDVPVQPTSTTYSSEWYETSGQVNENVSYASLGISGTPSLDELHIAIHVSTCSLNSNQCNTTIIDVDHNANVATTPCVILGQCIYNGSCYDVNQTNGANEVCQANLTWVLPQDTTAPTWTTEPSDISMLDNESVSEQYGATDDVAIDSWSISDATNFAISQSGLLTNTQSLNEGNYSINISVNDTSGNVLSKLITVTVQSSFVPDTSAPTWSTQPSDVSILDNDSVSQQFSATDDVAIDTWSVDDTTNFAISQSGLLTNISNLSATNYTVNVSVNDTSNNILSSIIIVEVISTYVPNNDTNITMNTTNDTTYSALPNAYIAIDFSASSTAQDTSGNNYNPTVTGATYSSTGGPNDGGYYSFDGNDIISFDNSQPAVNADAVTVAMWVRKTGTQDTYEYALAKRDGSVHSYGLSNRMLNGVPSWWFFSSSYWTAAQYPISMNEWEYVVGTYDRFDGQIRLYIDGVEVATRANTATIPISSAVDVILGARRSGSSAGSTYYFEGDIALVEVYDRAITAQEVLDQYNLMLGSELPADDDNDGYNINVDCDDNNNSVWQNLTGYVDSDGDLYTVGNAQVICTGASLPTGYSSSSLGVDCNDNDQFVNPGATEVCGDGIDNDCSAGDLICPENATCSDGIQNQNEIGVDCGGECPSCSAGQLVIVDSTANHQYKHAVWLPEGYEVSSSEGYPLLVFLHGHGDVGDPVSAVAKSGPMYYVNESWWDFPFIVVNPVANADWHNQNTGTIDTFISEIVAEYNVDADRVYATGLSAGAFGLSNYINDYQETLAAYAPISGYITWSPCNSKGMGLWYFHNDEDPVVGVGNTDYRIHSIHSFCGNPVPDPYTKLSIFDDTIHDAWTRTYDPSYPASNYTLASIGYQQYQTDYGFVNGEESLYDWFLRFENVPNSCRNEVQDGDETGVDCGGSCPTCVSGQPLCSNGYRDDGETGIDCGGVCGACS